MENNIFLLVGILGAATTLYAFIMNELDIWTNYNLKYDLLNFIASVALMIYAVSVETLPFFILNLIWGMVALKDIISKFVKD